jgi:hypothetical protein
MNLVTHYTFESSSVNKSNQLYNYAYNIYDAQLNGTNILPSVGLQGPNNNTLSMSFNSDFKHLNHLP